MSHLLWKYYWDQDVDRFRRLLASSSQSSHAVSKSSAGGNDHGSHLARSAGGHGTSPRGANKPRRASAFHPASSSRSKDAAPPIGKLEINCRDHAGLTILLRVASSTDPNAREFAQALIEHPAIDLYVQDPESGWNALHRSLYAGNVSIARMLLKKEREYLTSHTATSLGKVGMLIKTKDNEGHSPFDLYNSTIATRSLQRLSETTASDSELESEDGTGDRTEQ